MSEDSGSELGAVTTLGGAVNHGDLDARLATLRTMAEVLDESGLGEGA